jgi:hypothetical protein
VTTTRIRLLFAVLVALSPLIFAAFVGSEPPKPETKEYAGKVAPLTDALDKFGAKLDKDAAPFWLALMADNGQVYPLIKDSGSRMFFKDKQLLDRPMRITGRLFGDTKMLQVLAVRSVVGGKLHEPYYWCDVCKIKRFEPRDCECCGAPMVFREDPLEK